MRENFVRSEGSDGITYHKHPIALVRFMVGPTIASIFLALVWYGLSFFEAGRALLEVFALRGVLIFLSVAVLFWFWWEFEETHDAIQSQAKHTQATSAETTATIQATGDGAPLAGALIEVAILPNGGSVPRTVSGDADANGEFAFTYDSGSEKPLSASISVAPIVWRRGSESRRSVSA